MPSSNDAMDCDDSDDEVEVMDAVEDSEDGDQKPAARNLSRSNIVERPTVDARVPPGLLMPPTIRAVAATQRAATYPPRPKGILKKNLKYQKPKKK